MEMDEQEIRKIIKGGKKLTFRDYNETTLTVDRWEISEDRLMVEGHNAVPFNKDGKSAVVEEKMLFSVPMKAIKSIT